jgi:ABC-type amino acid transport substrate-binding protein
VSRLPISAWPTRRGLLAAALGAAPGVRAAGEPGLRIGGFEIAPLVMGGPLGGDPLVGAVPEYLKSRVALQLSFPLHWQALMTFERGARSLEDGSLDLLMLVAISSRPADRYRRFDWAVTAAQPQLALRADAPLEAVPRVEVLAGMEIGWVAHSRLPEGLETVPIRWRRLSSAHWQAVALRMLDAGRLDAVYFANAHSARYWGRRLGLALRLLPLPLPPRQLTLAYSLHADAGRIASFDRVAAPQFAADRFRRYLADREA